MGHEPAQRYQAFAAAEEGCACLNWAVLRVVEVVVYTFHPPKHALHLAVPMGSVRLLQAWQGCCACIDPVAPASLGRRRCARGVGQRCCMAQALRRAAARTPRSRAARSDCGLLGSKGAAGYYCDWVRRLGWSSTLRVAGQRASLQPTHPQQSPTPLLGRSHCKPHVILIGGICESRAARRARLDSATASATSSAAVLFSFTALRPFTHQCESEAGRIQAVLSWRQAWKLRNRLPKPFRHAFVAST
jgi:hypothetical protein